MEHRSSKKIWRRTVPVMSKSSKMFSHVLRTCSLLRYTKARISVVFSCSFPFPSSTPDVPTESAQSDGRWFVTIRSTVGDNCTSMWLLPYHLRRNNRHEYSTQEPCSVRSARASSRPSTLSNQQSASKAFSRWHFTAAIACNRQECPSGADASVRPEILREIPPN